MDTNELRVGLIGALNRLNKQELYRRLAIFYGVFVRTAEDMRGAYLAVSEIEEMAYSINDPTLGIMVLIGIMDGTMPIPSYMKDNKDALLEGIVYIVYGDPLYEALVPEDDRERAKIKSMELFMDDMNAKL
jgi:hypothetical protein